MIDDTSNQNTYAHYFNKVKIYKCSVDALATSRCDGPTAGRPPDEFRSFADGLSRFQSIRLDTIIIGSESTERKRPRMLDEREDEANTSDTAEP